MRDNHQAIAELKRFIRGKLNMAAARGQIDGVDAFAILQTVAAEFVARVCCDEHRQQYVDAVRMTFGDIVEREMLDIEHMTRQ